MISALAGIHERVFLLIFFIGDYTFSKMDFYMREN